MYGNCAECGHRAWTHGEQTGSPPEGAECHAFVSNVGDQSCHCEGYRNPVIADANKVE